MLSKSSRVMYSESYTDKQSVSKIISCVHFQLILLQSSFWQEKGMSVCFICIILVWINWRWPVTVRRGLGLDNMEDLQVLFTMLFVYVPEELVVSWSLSTFPSSHDPEGVGPLELEGRGFRRLRRDLWDLGMFRSAYSFAPFCDWKGERNTEKWVREKCVLKIL